MDFLSIYLVACLFPYMLASVMWLQSLARELVSSRKVVGRLYENRAQLNSVSMHLGESVGKAMISSLQALMSRSLYKVEVGLRF